MNNLFNQQYINSQQSNMENFNLEWLFDKIFLQLTNNCNDFYVDTVKNLFDKTFNSNKVHKILSKMTKITINEVKDKLANKKFKNRILKSGFKNKLHVCAIFNNVDKLNKYLLYGYEIDYNFYKLVCINGLTDFNHHLEFKKYAHDNELIGLCAEFSNYNHYEKLKNFGNIPNRHLYKKACKGSNLNIVKEVATYIALTPEVVDTAFKYNNNSIIKFIIDEIVKTDFKINCEVMSYSILNSNYEIINLCQTLNLLKWKPMLYNSAILSKSIEMVKYIEQYMDVHKNKDLDKPLTLKKFKSNRFLNEMLYFENKNKYFSHTINYAIQSNSIDIISYIIEKNYQITISNLITALQQASDKVLDLLCTKYTSDKKLSIYVLYYFAYFSFIKNKYKKLDILIKYNLIDLNEDIKKKKVEDYDIEKIHLELIKQATNNNMYMYDYDFLLQSDIFISKNVDVFYLVKLRYYMHINDNKNILCLIKENIDYIQSGINFLFLFGKIEIITFIVKNFDFSPSTEVVAELVCQNSLQKLCIIVHNNRIIDINYILKIVYLLNCDNLHRIFGKYNYVPSLKDAITSKNKVLVKKWINDNSNDISSIDDAKIILASNNYEIIKLFNYSCDIKCLIDTKIYNDNTETKYYINNCGIVSSSN